MYYPHVLFFWRAHCFSFPRKKSHVRTSERIVFARPLPSPYASLLCVTDAFRVTWSEKAFGCLPAVHLGYVTGCIDREGLERRRTGTRQARLHVSVFDSRSSSTEFYVIDLTRNLFSSPLPFWAIHRVSLTHLLRSCPWVISWTLTL